MSAPHPLLAQLARRGLLRRTPDPDEAGLPAAGEPAEGVLLRLCQAGLLEGGLSVALDVRPDELFGPLVAQMGGPLRAVRLLDVRERPVLELEVAWAGRSERWEVEGLEGLVHNLNSLLAEAGSRQGRPAAVLGEWQDALQVWCVPQTELPWLLRAGLGGARNAAALQEQVERG